MGRVQVLKTRARNDVQSRTKSYGEVNLSRRVDNEYTNQEKRRANRKTENEVKSVKGTERGKGGIRSKETEQKGRE